jgi:hypothetical protein
MLNLESVFRQDLAELVNKMGGSMKRVQHGWHGCCPIHNGDNPTAFSIFDSDGKQRWKCFTGSCGTGDIIDFVMKMKKCDWKDAVKYLGGDVHLTAEESAHLAAERAERATREMEIQIQKYQQVLSELKQESAHLHYYENMVNTEHRELWRNRGIPDVYQDIWQLGYCSDFVFNTSQGKCHTPTLTIPIYGQGEELLNVRHRLLNPSTPNDKYRPDRPGLDAQPFIADPGKGYDLDRVLVIEGEIKSMCTYITADDPDLQVLGIPGKSFFPKIADRLQKHTVFICLDPGAEKEMRDGAKMVNGRIITYPMKIDDAINSGALDKKGIQRLMKVAERAK